MAITIDLSGQPDGLYTVEDDGTPGNGTSVVRRPDGTILTTFAHPADAVTIVSRAGQSININITDSLTTSNFTVGSLTVPASNPDNIQIGGVLTSGTVTLVARGAITEWGSDGASDIVAGKLFMKAESGIGAFNAIETQVSTLEAESNTGGINLSNINDLTIGGAGGTASLRGLWAGTSGNVTLVNQGSILLSDNDGVESARSGGSLNLTAIGAAADISSNVNRDALLAVGNIVLTAGRDIRFGTVGTDFDNDVRAGGSIAITAGRDFQIDGFSDMAADDQGLASNGGVTITVGRDILIEDDFGVDASVGVTATGSTGAIVLTTGVGGTLSLAANSSAAIQGRNGGVTINADRILIENDSGINVSGTGTAIIKTASFGRGLLLGSATDGVTALELSDAELDRVVASNVRLGGDSTGYLTVVGAITSTINNLTLRTGGDLVVNASITAPQNLLLTAGESVIQNIGSTITAGSLFVQVDNQAANGGTSQLQGTLVATSIQVSGHSKADILIGTEAVDQIVNGFGGADTITSSGEGHYYGGDGNDTMFAGLSSGAVPEVLDGGAGIDTLNTGSFTGAYQINLATGVTNYGFESFVNFENLVTSNGADTIIGTAADNSITTLGGIDIVNGGIGNDTLNGGTGNDTLDGSLGFDVAVFSGNVASYGWMAAGQTTTITGPDGTDTLIEVERMVFNDATYAYTSTGFDAPALFTAAFGASAAAGGWVDQRTYPRLVADVDGNGLPDLVGFGSGGVYVAFTASNGTPGTASLVLDYFGASAGAGGWTDQRYFPRALGDINGDNRADIVGFGGAGVYAALANGSGGFDEPYLALTAFGSDLAAGGWSDNRVYPRMLGDVNGDGLDDLIGFGDGGVLVSLATGGGSFGALYQASSGFGAGAAAGGWSDDDLFPRTVADINNDGRVDIVGFGSGGVYVALAQENGTFGTPAFVYAGFGSDASAGAWTSNDLYPRTVGDMDGDGNADLVGFGDGGVIVAYGNGAGSFSASGVALQGFGAGPSGGNWTSNNAYPRFLADMNGDSIADVVGFGDGGVITATSQSDWVLV